MDVPRNCGRRCDFRWRVALHASICVLIADAVDRRTSISDVSARGVTFTTAEQKGQGWHGVSLGANGTPAACSCSGSS